MVPARSASTEKSTTPSRPAGKVAEETEAAVGESETEAVEGGEEETS